jgi:Neuraminidase (sialidase)
MTLVHQMSPYLDSSAITQNSFMDPSIHTDARTVLQEPAGSADSSPHTYYNSVHTERNDFR